MRHLTHFLTLFVTIFLLSCDNSVDNGNNTNNQNNTYYFRLIYNGTEYYEEAYPITQLAHSSTNELGGNVPTISIDFLFQNDVKNLDLNTVLEGQKIYFNAIDSFPTVSILHNIGVGQARYTENAITQQSLGNSYYVDVSEVNFLKNDANLNMDVYEVRATFNTRIEDGNGGFTEANGDFFIECTHTTN